MMEARCSTMVVGVRQEDIVQPMEVVETRSEVSIDMPPTEPNIVPTVAEPSAIVPTSTELPLSSPIAPSTDAARGPQ